MPSCCLFAPLNSSVVNPISTPSGGFGGEVLGLEFNVDFSDAGLLPGASGIRFGDLILENFSTLPALNGLTVRQFLADENTCLGGGSCVVRIADLGTTLGDVNGSFFEGTQVTDGVADVVVSSAHADIGCPQPLPPPPASCPDFVTGGGWIVAPSGARGNFAVAGGLKNGALWGHLAYIDHGGGPKVKGTGVTGYDVIDDTRRRISGTAEIDDKPGFTYVAEVEDAGEPGRSDRFTLKLSNEYTASGNLGGGNIQLHTCP